MIKLYKYMGIILIPFIKINLLLRIMNGKENKIRIHERYGKSSIKRPVGDLVWLHAASIGEFKSADLIINKLYKKYTILVTTTTLSAANYASKYYSQKIIHQFAPLDIYPWVNSFLNKWEPKLVVWIESDLWPTTMYLIKKKTIKSLLVNVRMSPNSFEKWKKIKFFYRQITDCFSDIFAQSQLDRERIIKLTNRDVQYIGNLKLSSNLVFENNKKNSNLLISKKILMLASTHENEEEQLLPIIKNLLKQIKNLKIIIAPRHIERSDSILKLFNKNNIISKIIDENNEVFNEDVFIINTFGNMHYYFDLSDVVFLGGSIVKKGGHNPIEPANNNCAILSGPHIFNWQNIYEDMLKNEACLIIQQLNTLEKNIYDLFTDDNLLMNMKKRSIAISQKKFFESEKLMNSMNKLLGIPSC